MKPKTLYDIYHEIMKNRTGLHYFRVRNTQTLSDFLICNHETWEWDYRNAPKLVWALLLKPNFNVYWKMDCHSEVYALLSSNDELQCFKGQNKDSLLDCYLKKSYKE